jgi:hypothetical protein
MAESKTNQAVGLATRVSAYVVKIERLVTQGIEHPRYEFTVRSSTGNDDKKSRLDLVKFIQGMANAHNSEERSSLARIRRRRPLFMSRILKNLTVHVFRAF